jgi:hypothetical protein
MLTKKLTNVLNKYNKAIKKCLNKIKIEFQDLWPKIKASNKELLLAKFKNLQITLQWKKHTYKKTKKIK